MNTPYVRAARAYFDSGWSPIPLPHEQKSPVPDQYPAGTKTMFTGAPGVYVTREHLDYWLKTKKRANAGKLSYPPGNVALRLPHNVIGIDVDAYGEKKGEQTLAAAEIEWGPLPPTWVTTSKDDGVSGIRLFRIPPGLKWPGELPQGKGVELLRWDHRYAIVAPSVHDKTKREYRWLKEEADDSGDIVMQESPEEFPDAPPEDESEDSDIPWLPTEWVEGLTAGQEYTADALNEGMDAKALNRWLAERNNPDEPCGHMRKMMTRWSVSVQKAADDGGAHDEMRDAIWGALNDAKQGHAGVIKVLAHMRNVFLKAVEGRRPDAGSAKSEWARAVLRGGMKVTGDDNKAEEEDPCESLSGGSRTTPASSSSSGKPKKSSKTSAPSGGGSGGGGGPIGSNDIEECTEVGNANRLVRVMAGRARWVEAFQTWYLWDEAAGVWAPDDSKQVDRWSVKAINGIEEEIAHLANYSEDFEAIKKAYMAHRKASLKVGAIGAMQAMAKGRKGMMVSADLLDADPLVLGVGNGTLGLGDEGAELKPARPEQYITMSTRVSFRPGALKEAKLWPAFLDRFQPDEEVREWLQRIVGYSLLGRNAGRYFVVMKGRTSTGKSTFAEAIRTVLGDYGGVMTASMLRDNQDDRPRPDLLGVLSNRIIVAEELGAAQHLHADQIKRLTGGTAIKARGMRSNAYVTRVPAFTPWIVSNDVPTIEGADNALKRRILVVPWDVQIKKSEEDLNFMTRLLAREAEAILAWAVEGYARYCESPRLGDVPAGALKVAGEFAEGMNEFGAWVSAACDIGEEFYEIPVRLFEAYQIWCAENGVPERDRMSNTAFGRKLNGMDVVKEKVSIEGKQVWVRKGIRLVKTKIESDR